MVEVNNLQTIKNNKNNFLEIPKYNLCRRLDGKDILNDKELKYADRIYLNGNLYINTSNISFRDIFILLYYKFF